MKNRYPVLCFAVACATLPPGLALAQAPAITGVAPGRNSANATPNAVSVTFSQPVTGGSGVRLFASQWQGLVTTTNTGDGTSQLSFQPVAGQSFRAGELVSVTVPATVQGSGGVATAGSVFQFRTRQVNGLFTGQYIGGSTLAEAGTSLRDPTLADVNGDGLLDLLLADTQNDRVRLRLGSSGALGAATLLNMGEQPGSIAVADVNNDGKLDLLTSTNPATNRAVAVALGTGQGGFGAPVAVPVPANTVPGQVRVGDVNADGNLDFVVTAVVPFATPAGPASAALAVRLGNGQGSFTAAPDVPVDLGADNLHLADFNNDGRLDCLVGSSGPGLLKLYLGNGQGSFVAAAPASLALTGPTNVADFTNDGVLDVLMADRTGNAVRIYPGTGTGGFGPATVLAATAPLAVHATDINGDGLLDVLATYNGGVGAAGMAVWANSINAPGTFSARPSQTNCAGTSLVTGLLGGAPSLVVVDNGVNGLSPNLKVRLNQPVLATKPAAGTLAATCYPNPAHGTVQLVLPLGAPSGLHAEVYNVLGQRVLDRSQPAVAAGAAATLDVSGLPAGLYTLRLTVGTQASSRALVVE